MLKLIYIMCVMLSASVVIAQEVKTAEQIAHEEAVKRNRENAKRLKRKHKANRGSLRRNKDNALHPNYISYQRVFTKTGTNNVIQADIRVK